MLSRLVGRWLGGRTALADTVRTQPMPSERDPNLDAQLNLGRDRLARGEYREAAGIFETVLAIEPACAAAHHGLGRAQYELSQREEAVDSLQLAVHYAPKDGEAHADLALALVHGTAEEARVIADRARELGMTTIRGWDACARTYKALGDLDATLACYARACDLDPANANLACQRAYVQFLRGEYEDAEAGFRHALRLDPDHVAALHNYGLLELETGRPQSALARFEHACALHASPETLACIAHALRDSGRLEDACAAYERVLEQHPDFGDARSNYAQTLLMRGDYERGWREYDYRFAAAGMSPRRFGLPLWRGEPLYGKRLLVFAEQGVGDEIMFASCLPDVLAFAGQCIVECDARLAPLFARSFPGAVIHGGRKSDDPAWLNALPRCDFETPIGSLPRYVRGSASAFANRASYLVADPERMSLWRQKLAGSGVLNVGFAWSGGALRSRQWLRTIPIEEWGELLRTPDCRFVALQHGPQARDLARSSAAAQVIDLCACSADLDELAAIVASLDLVISVDNALVHLAGALGIPTWGLLPAAPEWRYPREGERMVWYDSVRLFRQSGPRGGAAVLQAAQEALRTFKRSQ